MRFLYLTAFLLCCFTCAAQDFMKNELLSPRVQAARAEKDSLLKAAFAEKGLTYPTRNLFIRIFKAESVLEVWARDKGEYVLVKSYQICIMSGVLGPKRARGDWQVPEGFYEIKDFLRNSSYYLSLKLNYPNASDRLLKKNKDAGGDICIHGNCASAGCIAITDEPIKEVYWLAVQAKHNGQTSIPVHIFPARLSEPKLAILRQTYSNHPALIAFWENLKPGYDFFEKNKKLPVVQVTEKGLYQFK